MLNVTTEIYQAKNGAVFMNFGRTIIKLERDQADIVAYDIPDFSVDDFNNYYKPKPLST